MSNIQDTAHATIATAASKGTAAGAGLGILGWLTSDSIVGLIGLIVAVGGLAVNIAFRWLDRRDRRAREDARDAREVELHALRVREIETRLAAGGAATAGDSHE